jgi:hypothetical protein
MGRGSASNFASERQHPFRSPPAICEDGAVDRFLLGEDMKLRAVLILVVLAAGLPWSAAAVTRGELVCPVRADWEEGSEDCPCEKGWKPTEERLAEILAAHKGWRGDGGLNDPAVPGRAVLCDADLEEVRLEGADLGGADLAGANLRFALLEGADLGGANLNGADLRVAKLERADLANADLAGADFRFARLEGAVLGGADLRGADLRAAKLKNAKLYLTDLEGADLGGAVLDGALLNSAIVTDASLAFASLRGTMYAPASPPPRGYLEGIEGLATVTFPRGRQSGLVQVRDLLQKAGLRDLERQATFAIEHTKAENARRLGTVFERFGGWLQLVFFEWTTGWGLHPGRALAIMLALMGGFGFVYAIAIWDPPADWTQHGEVVRIRPAERLVDRQGARQLAGSVTAEPVATAGLAAALGWGLYFSMLSAFHIGWRDLNVGTWISRIQPSEFALRGRGWVRVVSGAQSLISVYLVAMWVLTYFGRPFQ